MARTAALVLRADSLLLFERLARDIPVWIADTAKHAELKSAPRTGEHHSLTWFPLKEDEPLEQAAIRIIYSLDQHYDELAQEVGYDTLWVIGIAHESVRISELAQLGFRWLEPAAGGFLALK